MKRPNPSRNVGRGAAGRTPVLLASLALAVLAFLGLTLVWDGARVDAAPIDAGILLEDSPEVRRPVGVLVFLHRGGRPLDGADVAVEAGFHHPGVPAVSAAAERLGGGDWFLTVDARLPDGGRVERPFVIGVAGADPH